jgi:hypothetical protein
VAQASPCFIDLKIGGGQIDLLFFGLKEGGKFAIVAWRWGFAVALEGEDGAGGVVEDVVADAAEEEFAESGAASSSDEDEVGVPVLGGAADHDSGVADVLAIFGGDSGFLGGFGEGFEPVEVLAFGAFPFLGVALQDGAVEGGVEGVDAGIEGACVAFLEDGEDVEEHEAGLVGLSHVDRLL